MIFSSHRMPVRHSVDWHCRFAWPASRYWLLTLAVLLIATGVSNAEYRLFVDFENVVLGPVGGQDGWVSASGDNLIIVDPDDVLNQALYVPSESSTLHKSLLDADVGVPDGTVRMMFMRIRVSNKQTFSVGLSHLTSPREFSDFAPEIGMANSAENLDLRAWDDDGGNYEPLTQLESDTWYNLWVLVDAASNEYEMWLNDLPGASASAGDKLSASDGDNSFVFRAGKSSNLSTFYVKTAGGGSGTNFGPVLFDDVYVENTDTLNLANPSGGASIPAVSDWGLITLLLLLAASGTIVLRGAREGDMV